MGTRFGDTRPSWAEMGRLHDRIGVLEQREEQYQRFILEGTYVNRAQKAAYQHLSWLYSITEVLADSRT